MSSDLREFKQKLLSLTADEQLTLLENYYTGQKAVMALNCHEKSYRCFECVIQVAGAKVCSGFGRSNAEAQQNAAKIALESVVDQADEICIHQLEVMLKGKVEPFELEPRLLKLLQSLDLEEYASVLIKARFSFDDLASIDLNWLKEVLPFGPYSRLTRALHIEEKDETQAELERLRQENAELKRLLNLDQPPAYLMCPLSHDLMKDPVITTDGHSFERSAIERWFKTSKQSPITGVELASKLIRSNYALKVASQTYLETLALLGAKPQSHSKPKDPCKNLYESVYGHHLPEPSVEAVDTDELKVLSDLAIQLMGDNSIEFHEDKENIAHTSTKPKGLVGGM
mmetsp:Transcript_26055/g.46236  ORF Transcript_26055/g.46236 Transcript_26055/m.46236 type:complete len:342 (+) Transcript_26055:1081-2106(+)|eukprot:CAMPEP_0204899854 /NCGR_PEP_ID=MMETSP1397-20131031/2095_1 /ASSEMBLY_ACC=CAM_ASM_000891 /TAXON_ID=49980 /ORGANISM="Climacostomum Climacostomum virens, Strain Stock W-24" /LENGTH=341 /DNA_ID=CAMNT_0052067865 /DNA_START=1128 /DNA_END=2153 /DNA_ORIENTATION=+